MSYERLLSEAFDNGLTVKEKVFKSKAKGLCRGNVIGINKNITTSVSKRCVLSEELGHYFTTVGDITDQTKIENRKQELKARRWGYEKLVPIQLLAEAINYKVQSQHELAEYLDVTEGFLLEAIKYYKEKYGLYCHFNEYTICFELLRLMKRFN